MILFLSNAGTSGLLGMQKIIIMWQDIPEAAIPPPQVHVFDTHRWHPLYHVYSTFPTAVLGLYFLERVTGTSNLTVRHLAVNQFTPLLISSMWKTQCLGLRGRTTELITFIELLLCPGHYTFFTYIHYASYAVIHSLLAIAQYTTEPNLQ